MSDRRRLEEEEQRIKANSDRTKDTAVLAMQVSKPILQMMREMDREGCEVTDELIRQASEEVKELADTTDYGIQKVLRQLKQLEVSFAKDLNLLQAAIEGKASTEAELDQFGQNYPRPSIVNPQSTSIILSDWTPVDFVSLFSPKDVDNCYDFSLVDTTRMVIFFSRVVYHVVLRKHPHFLAYNEVRIPCAAEGQGSLVVGHDPPSIANWGTWDCVNAMLKGSDDYCCCPGESKYCLRYQVWSISPDPAGVTQNILKLMWFEIDPLRTGWDVLQAMGLKYWIPVNFVALFSSAEHAGDNHPQWCDMSVVDDFFVALMIGDSSGKREQYFRHANYFLEDAELDGSDGVISNHCDFQQNGENDLDLVDWHAELSEDQDMENWQCLNFVLALSGEEAEEHLRSVRIARPDQQDHDGWTLDKCCCPGHTPFCLAIRSESRSNTSGEGYKVIRVKWIQRSNPSFESGRMLASPVHGVVDPEVQEKLNTAFKTCAVEEYDQDETDDDDQQTGEHEEMGGQADENYIDSLFGGSDVDEGGGCQDGSPDTLDFEHVAPGSPACWDRTRAYSPRQALPGLIDRQVAGKRRCWPDEHECKRKSKRRRVVYTSEGSDSDDLSRGSDF
ncbi:hypothetical protein QBC40DRAFT_167508 [Triangularia verruculosa]|uniref:Uncharacterized protein n=1 Tax=Triangularia verruculosa TaxID=2587418 RepID=A0AAN6XSW0_9PEZI|nr:hypothetical protein QBC40DRAFT_167508 [Triangularia verruculosa]